MFEPNDSPVLAPQHDRTSCGHDDHDDRGRGLVRLPFNTANRFSEISPLGDDVDFFRFRAKAGDILAIETVPGLQSLDTVIGSSTPRATSCSPTTTAASACCRACWCRSRWTARTPWA